MNIRESIVSNDTGARAESGGEFSIGQILARQGQVDAADIERMLAMHRAEGVKVGEAAIRLGLIDERELDRAIALQYRQAHRALRETAVGEELDVAADPGHPCAEAYRSLRTQLLIRWSKAGIDRRALAVVSPGSAEGRSHVAANLAVAFAQIGERTLLVDADMRSPRQHRIFDVPDCAGLGAVLAGRADIGAAVPLPQFGALSLLPAGPPPPNPQELLSGATMAAQLDEWHREFDLILFDTPPATRYADAQLVAFRAGAAMVLARRDRSRLKDIERVIRDLDGTGACVFGSVLTVF